MKPRFALDLTNDAIGLLERTGDGWVRIARADLDDTEIEHRLLDLRRTAEALAPDGFFTKLILPNSQILYLEVEAPGPDRSSRRMQIRKALEGRTPYGVDDLVFDWSRNGPKVKVAVLARETLDEAEAFAEANGFRPVAFVAVPDGDRFAGEPFFGLTLRHLAHLPRNERFDRDQDPVRIVRDDTPPRVVDVAPVINATEDSDPHSDNGESHAELASLAEDTIGADEMTAEAVAEARLSPIATFADSDDVLLPEGAPDEAAEAPFISVDDLEELPARDVAEAKEASVDPASMRVIDEPEATPEAHDADVTMQMDGASGDKTATGQDVAEPATIDLTEIAEGVDFVEEEATSDAVAADDASHGEVAGELAVTEPAVAAKGDESDSQDASAGDAGAEMQEDGTVAVLAGELTDEGVPAENDAAIISVVASDAPDFDAVAEPPEAANAFQSRRSPGPSGLEGARLASITPRLGGFTPAGQAPKSAPRLGSANTSPKISSTPLRTPVGKTPLAAALEASSAAAGRVTRAASSGKSALAGKGLVSVLAQPSRTGVIAASAAAIVVAALAAWSLWPSGSGTVDPATTSELVTPTPDVADQGSPEVPDVPDQVAEAAQAPSVMPDGGEQATAAATSMAEPSDSTATDAAAAGGATDEGAAGTDTPTPATAAAVQPAPDLPQPVAPTATAVLGQTVTTEGSDAPAIAASEPAAPGAGAITLPALGPVAGDAPLAPQPLPQPFGTLLRYDANGMIEATPDGVVTPDGFTLFDARPPILPKARPAALNTAAANDPVTGAPNPLAGKLPKPRPAGLVVPTPPPAATPPATPPATEPVTNGAATPDAAAPDSAATATATALPAPAPPVDPRHAGLTPKTRPAKVAAAALAARQNAEAVAAAAEAAAKAEAEARQAALANASKYAVASSRQPALRPASIVKVAAAAAAAKATESAVQASAVEAALAEAQTTAEPAPEPQPQPQVQAEPAPDPTAEVEEPELSSDGVPNMPTTRTVAKKATIANALDLGDINLIGVFGSSSNRRALVRMPTGRLVKVQVGDRLDGGRVAAIGDNELSYVKKGRTYVLKMIRDS